MSLLQLTLCYRYPKRLHKVVRRLLPECHVRFVLSDCGSSKGAALVTAVAQRLAVRRQQVGCAHYKSAPYMFLDGFYLICLVSFRWMRHFPLSN